MNSAGTGNWSTGATWVGGVAPTAADAAVILNTHVVTLTDATCVCDSLTINSGGQLAVNGAADTKLVVDKGIAVSSTTGYLNLDMSAAPTKKCEIYINADAAAASSLTTTALNIAARVTLKGAQKTAWTLTSAAMTGGSTTSVHVDDATGWVVADKLVFATTQAFNATPKTDAVTIATLTFDSGTTGPATVTWTDGTGAGGSVENSHADNCLVGNFTRNLIFGPAVAGNMALVYFNQPGANGSNSVVNDVEFRSCGSSEPFGGSAVVNFLLSNSSFTSLNRCAFWEHGRFAMLFNATTGAVPRDSNVIYSSNANAGVYQILGNTGELGNDVDLCVFRGVRGLQTGSTKNTLVRPKISGLTGAVVDTPSGIQVMSVGNSQVQGGGVWACKFAVATIQSGGGEVEFKETWFGKGFSGAEYTGAGNDYLFSVGGTTGCTIDSCPESLTGGTGRFSGSTRAENSTEVRFFNRDGSATNQDIYSPLLSTTSPTFSREATEIKNANASMRIDTLGSPTLSRVFEVLVKGGTAASIFLYVKKNAAYNDSTYTLPSATLSGLGITPITASGTNVDDTWELLDLSYASGAAPTNDGVLTLTLSAQSATATGKAYFSGIPIAPFVTRCRHYGYLFDETSPTRTADIAKSAVFATADAYTGITITWGATSSTTITADNTFQKLYDYHQAKAIANVSSAVALTGAGAAGSPALFAQGNVTINTTKQLNGPGSLAMSTGTLTSDVPWAFTYTSGTFSKASSSADVTFNGGTLNIGAAGTYTFTMAGSTTVSATPTSASNYVLSSGTFTGTLTFHNTTAYNITVEVPTGTTTSSVGSPGAGTVTFVSPQLYQSVVVSGITTGARVQIYDTTNSIELFNGTASAGDTVVSGSTVTWTDPTAAVGARAIRIRVSYVNGATAKNFIETSGLSCGVTSGTESITYPVSPTDDAVYNANGITGSGVTGVTFTDAATDVMNINVVANAISWKTIYAAWVYYAFGSTGIASDIDYIDAVDEANYILSNLIIKNTSSPTAPLEITGGYGRDFTTGATIDLADTTGGTLIFAPDHVVSYAVGSGVTAQDITDIATASGTAAATATLAAAQTTPIHSDIRKVNSYTVDGDGQTGTEWGPV